jgi:hypothetical protein
MQFINPVDSHQAWYRSYILSAMFCCTLPGGSLFALLIDLVNEDVGVLVFFFCMPIAIGLCCALILKGAQRLFQMKLPPAHVWRAGLLATACVGVTGILLPRIALIPGVVFSEAASNLFGSGMMVGIWGIALLASLALFPVVIRY